MADDGTGSTDHGPQRGPASLRQIVAGQQSLAIAISPGPTLPPADADLAGNTSPDAEPTDADNRAQRIIPLHMKIPADWITAIDAVAKREGIDHRSRWIRRTLLQALRYRGITGLRDIPDRRLSRIRHHSLPAHEIKRRRARAADRKYKRRRKSGQVAREKLARIEFTFTADNTVLASDLDGAFAAIIYSDGGIGMESRHPFERILYELRQWYRLDKPITEAMSLAIRRYDGHADSSGATSL